MKEISRIYKITGFGSSAEYYTFTYPNGREVKIPNLYDYDRDVEVPNPDIRNIKYTKQIISGATYDIPI